MREGYEDKGAGRKGEPPLLGANPFKTAKIRQGRETKPCTVKNRPLGAFLEGPAGRRKTAQNNQKGTCLRTKTSSRQKMTERVHR